MEREPTPEQRARRAILRMADWSGVLDELAGDDAAVVTALRFVLAPSRVLADDDYEMEDALESGGDAVAVTAMVLGTERTQTLVDAVGLEEPLDVAEMLRIHVRVLDAQRVVASGDKSIADCVAAVRELPPTHWARRDLLHSLAVHRPITEVLAFDSFDSFERSVLGPALQRRVSGHEAVRAMLAAGHGLESIARAVTEHWPETPLPSAPRDAVETIARLLVACGRPVSELFDFVPSDAVDARLLGRLRPSGLRAPIAALTLVERRGLAPIDVAQTLTRAGYDDDAILEALRTNGLGTVRSIDTLHRVGWSAERMTDSLFALNTSLTEIRDHLADVGVPRDTIVTLLASRVPMERVRLVCS